LKIEKEEKKHSGAKCTEEDEVADEESHDVEEREFNDAH